MEKSIDSSRKNNVRFAANRILEVEGIKNMVIKRKNGKPFMI
jgi:hypothetical protein